MSGYVDEPYVPEAPGLTDLVQSSIVVPGVGAVVDLREPAAVAQALHDLRGFEERIRDAKAALAEALVSATEREGSRTLRLPGIEVTVGASEETVYDAQAVEEGLRAAGMSEDRIGEVVVQTVTSKVKATEAKRAARANPDYAAVIEAATTVVPKRPTVSVKVAP